MFPCCQDTCVVRLVNSDLPRQLSPWFKGGSVANSGFSLQLTFALRGGTGSLRLIMAARLWPEEMAWPSLAYPGRSFFASVCEAVPCCLCAGRDTGISGSVLDLVKALAVLSYFPAAQSWICLSGSVFLKPVAGEHSW